MNPGRTLTRAALPVSSPHGVPDLSPTAVVAVIPARLGSTRFPQKVIADRTGRPLVQHVVDRVRGCRYVSEVIVATDSRTVADALAPFGTTVVMTGDAHESGTDRIAEVMRGRTESVVVNVQGDEPEIDPAAVDAVVACLAASGAEMATAVTPFPADCDPADPSRVKAVVAWDGPESNGAGRTGRAVYFSRAPVPHRRSGGGAAGAEPIDGPAYHLHLGLYAYGRAFLLRFAAWPPSPLERTEKLEQLRAVEHGIPIAVVNVDHPAGGIDTPEQYAGFVERWNRTRHGDADTRSEIHAE